MARLREKAMFDEASSLENARREGIEKGIEKGIEEGREEERLIMIEKMRRTGMTEEQIKQILDI